MSYIVRRQDDLFFLEKSSAKVQQNGSALWVKVGLRGKTPDKTRKSRSKGEKYPCAGRRKLNHLRVVFCLGWKNGMRAAHWQSKTK